MPSAAAEALAAAEPRYIAPGLVEAGEAGPRLIAGQCKACAALSFPKAPVCSACLSQEIETAHLSSEGTLYASAVVHQAPNGWDVPYTLGYVDLTDGIRVLAHIDGDAPINARVRLGVGRVGADQGGTPLMSYVFRPAAGGGKS